ncbi:MAG: PorV/PorQ family protein [Elusimicrobia bacterium]|nr:PorV/PorQ family protein [Elusimicrobiota bacterium]
MRKLLIALLLVAVAAGRARAIGSQTGTSGAQFLKLGAGARAGGMADAFTAVADDAYAVYYNPAGLSQITQPQLAGAHTAYFQGVSYEVVNFAYPMAKQADYSGHVLALGIYQLSVSDIQRRTSDSTDPVGTFGTSDGAYSVSYAYAANRRLSAGITAKYINESIDTYRSSAYAFDGGVLYHLNPDGARPVSLAATFRNAGSRTGYVSGNSDPLPTSFAFAAAMQVVPKALTVDAEVTRYRDTNAFASVGAEYNHKINDAIGSAFRLGYTTERTTTPGFTGPALGAGLSFKQAAFDFAWQPFGSLGDTFRYSLTVKF